MSKNREPIIPVMLLRLASHAENNDIKQFRSVKHRRETDLSGEYSGMLITYDWSGKRYQENNITLNIEQSGDNLSIRWEEGGGHLANRSTSNRHGSCFFRSGL